MNIVKLTLPAMMAAILSAPAFAGQKTLKIDVDGLVCAFCAQGIEKKLKVQPATDKVFVSLENKLVLVKLREGQDIADAQIKTDITDAGYVVRAVSRSDTAFEEQRDRIKASKAAKP